MLKIDLGAGHLSSNKIDRYKRYLGDDYNPSDYLKIDLQVVEGVDEICDFENEKLPLSENSVNEIVTIHTLEHIHNLDHIIKECSLEGFYIKFLNKKGITRDLIIKTII